MNTRFARNVVDAARLAVGVEAKQDVASREVSKRPEGALHVRGHDPKGYCETGLFGIAAERLEISRLPVAGLPSRVDFCNSSGLGFGRRGKLTAGAAKPMKTKLRFLRLAVGAPSLRAMPMIVAGLYLLPVPLPPPDVTATALGQAVSNVASVLPSPPVTVSPPVPPITSTTNALPTTTSAPAGGVNGGNQNPSSDIPSGSSSAPSTPNAPTTSPVHPLPIPFTTIVLSSPLDTPLLGALVTLPLLLAIWLLLFGRTFAEARRLRDSQIRLTLAADLGIRPREASSMSTKALFKLREQTAFDELTGVLRRAAGIAAAEHELARARRHRTPLAMAFVDVDGLKEANDRDGHVAGDRLVRGVADALMRGLRGQDLVLRYGGDEFVCVLPDTTIESARTKLRDVQKEADRGGMHFSFGVAGLERSDDIVTLLGRADRELYQFKGSRGEIVHLPPPGTARRRRRRRASA
jgi:diguanylate cyclase (GGDEF)-like protein